MTHTIREYVDEYEFRHDNGGGYTPTDGEKAMIEDAINGYLGELPHLAGWQPIETAPDGCITEDAGIRGESEWFYGRTAPDRIKQGAAPVVVIKRRAWPHEDSWRCNGDAYYVPSYFDAWMPLPPALECQAMIEAPNTREIHAIFGQEPMREGEYPASFIVGSKCQPGGNIATKIEYREHIYGDHSIGWYDVYVGENVLFSMSARAVAEIHWKEPSHD